MTLAYLVYEKASETPWPKYFLWMEKLRLWYISIRIKGRNHIFGALHQCSDNHLTNSWLKNHVEAYEFWSLSLGQILEILLPGQCQEHVISDKHVLFPLVNPGGLQKLIVVLPQPIDLHNDISSKSGQVHG